MIKNFEDFSKISDDKIFIFRCKSNSKVRKYIDQWNKIHYKIKKIIAEELKIVFFVDN